MEEQHTCPRCGYIFEPFEEGACPHCRHLAETHHTPLPTEAGMETEGKRTCPHCGYIFEPFEEEDCPHCRHLAERHPMETAQPEAPGTAPALEPPRLPAEPPQSHPLPSDAEAVARMRSHPYQPIASLSSDYLDPRDRRRNTPASYLMGTVIGLMMACGFGFAALNPNTSSGKGQYAHIATHDERLLLWGGAVFGAVLAIAFFIKFVNGDD